MAFDIFQRLGSVLGQVAVERITGRHHQATAEAPAAEAAPTTDASVEAPPAEATSQAAASEPVAEAVPAAGEAPYVPVSERAWNRDYSTPPPSTSAAAPEAAPAKSAEEIEEERLWNETAEAWAAGDFEKVTQSLDRLRELQPEDASIIDEKIAAAQYNQGAAFEQSGDLNRALYLYQEAQRRSPSLGEAGFAIERVQSALNPPAPAAEAAPAAPAEQAYTVQDGDSLWAIAERQYGDGSQYTRIFEANRDQLDNPDVIQPGQVLRIPA